MTLGKLVIDQNHVGGKNNFRWDGIIREKTCAKQAWIVSLLFGWCVVGFPVGVLAEDEPQELLKPFHKPTPPLFQEWLFDQSTPAHVPDGFSLEVGRKTAQGGWVVSKDATAPSRSNLVEQQLTYGEDLCYQLLTAEESTVEYVDLSVRMKMRLGTPSGKAGLAYGIQDVRNFYAVVVEPKTNEAVAYVVKDGQPKEIAREALILEPSEWHFLRIQRNTIVSKEFTEIFFDHHLLIDVYDQSFKKGKIGLVAMGDGAFSFDNLRAMELMTNRPLSRPAAY